MFVFVALVLGLCVVALLSYTLQGWQRVTPIGAFLAFEIAATWPAFALYANEPDPMTELPLLCAIAGGALATLAFWLAGGFKVETSLLRFDGTSPADTQSSGSLPDRRDLATIRRSGCSSHAIVMEGCHRFLARDYDR